MLWVVVPANFEALLEVRSSCPQRRRVSCVLDGDLFTPLARVAAVSLRRGPFQLVFCFERLAEEILRVGEGVFESGLGNRVILEIDEASCLETFENIFGGLLAFGRGARGKLGKVNQLDNVQC